MLQIVMAFAPLVFLILYALKTRKMADAMVLATLLAMVLLHRQHFLTGTIDAMYAALSNSSYQFALCVIIGFGGMITLFQESGALMGFRDLLLKIASGPKRTLVLAWLMSAIMFLDEYLSALTVTFSMREITDKNRIPREHLALQANIIACCLCVAVPFSSWTAFSVGLISAHGLGFSDYVRAIPYMFYPLGMLLLCLLLAVGAFPKLGGLKRAYQRVQSGGLAFERDDATEKLVDIPDVDESCVSSAWNAIVPLAVLVGGTIAYGNDLVHGMIMAIIAQFLLYIPQKIMTVGKFFEHFFNGAKGMTTLAIVVGWLSGSKASGLFTSYITMLMATVYFASLIFFVLEHKVNPMVTDYWSALWWAFMDVTTVGSNIYAVTPTGKILSVVLAALGMMMFPIFTVYVTSLVQQANKRKEEYYQSQQSEPADTK